MAKRKSLLLLLVAIVALVAMIALVACDDKPQDPGTVTITYAPGFEGLTEAQQTAWREAIANDTVEIAKGEEITLPELAIEREHYDFAGWKIADGDVKAAGAKVKIEADTTITAQWDIETHTVNFKVGEDVFATKTVDYNATVADPGIPQAPQDKAGWTFRNWKIVGGGGI